MSSMVGEWLKSPVFPGDDNKTRAARTLHIILIVCLGGVLIYTALLLGYARNTTLGLVLSIPVVIFVAGLIHLMKRGLVQLSGLLFVFLSWLSLTAVIVSYGYGMQGAGMLGYILIVIAAGLLVNGRLAIIFAILNILSGYILIYSQKLGLINGRGTIESTITIWILQSLFSLFIAILLHLVLKNLYDALKQATRSESYYRMLFETAPVGVLIVDSSNRIVMVNKAIHQIIGFQADEMIGQSPLRFVSPADIVQKPPRSFEQIKTPHPTERERILLHKDGSLVNAIVSSSYMADGRLQFIIQNITRRKRMEEELRISEEKYRMISSVVSDYIFSNVKNERGEFILNWATGALQQISGYTLDEFNARGGWISTLHPDDVEQDARDMEMLKNNKKVVSELRTIHKDGSIRWVRSYTHPVWDEQNNELAGICGAVQDITQQKQAEQEGEELIQLLESKNAELEQFAYTISHDLKSPIITIRGFLGFLENDAVSGNITRLRSDIQRIGEAADKMYSLLNDLLELSRVGRVTNEPKPILFSTIIENACRNLHGQLTDREVELIVNHPLPIICGDGQRLLQVVQNLLDNAAKFTNDQARPMIEIGQCCLDKDGFVTFYIRDNGMGIDVQYHDRIFGLFNRLNPNIEGTGIGLALVKRIVEFHGGRIWVESEAGHGSTFFFTLPLANQNEDNLPESI